MTISGLLSLACFSTVWAITADPNPFEHTQPDGTKISVRLAGDEFFHWREDQEGFTVLLRGQEYVYAQLDAQNRLAPTDWRVGSVDPRTVGLKPHLLPPRELRPVNLNRRRAPYRPWADQDDNAAGAGMAAQRIVKNLVILCKFADHTFAAHTRPQADYEILFNHDGDEPRVAPTGSVRDAFLEYSYGILDLRSTVLAWVTLPQNESYYAGTNNGLGLDYPNNAQKMVEDALALADSLVDFGQFDDNSDGFVDAIGIIHSGYGAESTGSGIWSHRWGLPANWTSADANARGVKVKVNDYHTEPAFFGRIGTDIIRIGVIVHETGHFFGLPDLYDTDGQNGNEGTRSAGLGAWCAMADSWGFDRDQLRPSHYSAWCKVFLGWVKPTELAKPGVYSLVLVESGPILFKVTRNFPEGEYLLIENRQPVGLDFRIPRGGLAIWHIDELVADNTDEGFPGQPGWPANGNHYRIALLQADGQYDLERNNNKGDAGDLYQMGRQLGPWTLPSSDRYQSGQVSSTRIEISNISAADPLMTFFFGYSPVLFVNRLYTGGGSDGSLARPYTTVRQAYDRALDGFAIFIAGNTYPEAPIALGKILTFDSYDGAATIR